MNDALHINQKSRVWQSSVAQKLRAQRQMDRGEEGGDERT
jgi:hypothetical protein